MVPSFDLTGSGGIGLALVRGIADAAMLLVFGTTVLGAVVAPAALALVSPLEAKNVRTKLRQLGRRSSAAAIVGLGVWLVLVARSLVDATGAVPTVEAAWTVISDTTFGHIVLLEIGSLVLVVGFLLAAPRRDAAAVIAAGLALALHGWHGHAYGMGAPLLILSASLHLLAAGGWLGSLPVFALLVKELPLPVAAELARRFSPFGIVSALTLALTAFYQGWTLVGSWGALTSTAYGSVALLKLLLLLVLVGLGAINRIWITPRLSQFDGASGAKSALLCSVGLELIAGLAIVLAAGLLGSLPSSMRM